MQNNSNNRKSGSVLNQGREELDKMIKDRLGQGSLVTAMEQESDKKSKEHKAARGMSWGDEIKKHPGVYIFLGVSALFTLTLGLFMGIAPHLDPLLGAIVYQTDVMHIFLALVYMIAFFTVTEGAFVMGKWKFHTRENENDTQYYTMLAMMFLAGISIIGTGIAGGLVVASNIAFLTAFIEIPEAAQKWVIVIIPVLLACYAFLLTAYTLSSKEAKAERMLELQKRQAELDHETRQRSIMQIAMEDLQVEELKRYLQLVQDGKISAAQARAAILAGRTLGEEEIRQGVDLDGRAGVGNAEDYRTQPNPRPAPRMTPAPVTLNQNVPQQVLREYNLDDLLVAMKETPNGIRAKFAKYNLTAAQTAWRALMSYSMLPADLSHMIFNRLYAVLFPTTRPA